MKQLILLVAVACTFWACEKSATSPNSQPSTQFEYTNLNEREVKFNEGFGADLDHDGANDFLVYTMYVGDPLLQRDYKRFLFGSTPGTFFPINQQEQIPKLGKGALINEDAFTGYTWHEVAAIVVAQKVITNTQNYWEGVWLNAVHQYLPFRKQKEGKWYYGWVEVSFDAQAEKVILHQAAICKEGNKGVLTGK